MNKSRSGIFHIGKIIVVKLCPLVFGQGFNLLHSLVDLCRILLDDRRSQVSSTAHFISTSGRRRQGGMNFTKLLGDSSLRVELLLIFSSPLESDLSVPFDLGLDIDGELFPGNVSTDRLFVRY